MRRQSFRERALVIRTYDFGEADRIIVLLTRGSGLVRGVAKGVRRAKSRFGSRLQPFVELDVQLYPGRSLALIAGADTVSYFASGIIEDLERYSAASAVLEAAERFSQASPGEEERLYDATIATLSEIQKSPHTLVVLDSYLLRGMAFVGWEPSLFACAACGVAGPHRAFHPAAGGAVCFACRPPGSAEVDPEVLHLMWLMAEGYAARVVETASPAQLNACHRLTRAYLQWHIERSLNSLDVYDQA